MAKRERDGGQSKVKFRLVEFELEGGDAALHESLRGIATTLARGVRTLPAVTNEGSRLPATAAANAEEEVGALDSQESADVPDEGNGSSPPRPRAPRKIVTPEIIELDLTSGPVNLKDFCEKRKPDSDWRKYLIIAYWLKKYRNLSEISVDHVHTCYRHMGWHTPKDAGQPLRDLALKQQWLSKAETRGFYTINHVGENEVDRTAMN